VADDQHERLVQPEPEVLEGDDELPRQPTSDRDPYVPEPYARPGERREWRTMRLALLPVLAIAAIILVYALTR
jgi:hypothetical protein